MKTYYHKEELKDRLEEEKDLLTFSLKNYKRKPFSFFPEKENGEQESFTLQGEIGIPSFQNIDKEGVNLIVLCHPHPLYGGNMLNNVISKLFHYFSNLGFVCFRFNFRGVRKSEGRYGEGKQEVNDVRGAVHTVYSTFPNIENVFLIGYSFGAVVAGALLSDPKVDAYIGISYPFSLIPIWIERLSYEKPRYFLGGTDDQFVPSHEFKEYMEKITPAPSYSLIENSDHFWVNDEEILCLLIKEWLKEEEYLK